MEVRLSSKGQLVIPRAIRRALNLHAGDVLAVEMAGNAVILRPLPSQSPLERLVGRFAGDDLIDALEEEHREELSRGGGVRA